MGCAIELGDLLYARSRGFKARVTRALDDIREGAKLGTIGVSYSGGKDSTCLLDLVRRVIPDVRAAFFDSGCEYPETYEMIDHYGVETIKPEMSLIELCQYGGYWGYEHPVDADVEINFGEWLVSEPSLRFTVLYDLDVIAMGLRAGESAERRLSAHQRGTLYQVKGGMWHLCPLAYWTDADVWAYIASRDLRYNGAYDKMAAAGMSRKGQRVGMLLGASFASHGRYAWLRMTYPELYNRLLQIFPKLSQYT